MDQANEIHRTLAAYAKFAGSFCVCFSVAFFGAGSVAIYLGRSIPLYMDWEHSIPLVPWMVWIYLSIFALWALPLLHLSGTQIEALSRQVNFATLLAGLIYILLPGELGYPTTPQSSTASSLVVLLDRLAAATGYNLVPSLHVVYGTLVLTSCMAAVSRKVWWLYVAWLILLSVSTVLTHQHHVLDVSTGILLALGVRALLPIGFARRQLTSEAARESDSASIAPIGGKGLAA